MAMTVRKRLEQAALLPDCQAKIICTLPDGWTIRRLERVSDLHREGVLMSNCLDWSEYRHRHRSDQARLRATGHTNRRYFSLRDPRNLPHLTFEVENWSGRVRGHSRRIRSVLGRHNAEPKPQHLERVYLWAATLPGRWYHSDGVGTGVPLTAACHEPLTLPLPAPPRKPMRLRRDLHLAEAA